jgi:hypothetical protein
MLFTVLPALPFTVSPLYVLFGFFSEIALNRVSPSVTCQTVVSVVASPSRNLTYSTGLRYLLLHRDLKVSISEGVFQLTLGPCSKYSETALLNPVGG